MDSYFDPAYFDASYFDVGAEQPAVQTPGGSRPDWFVMPPFIPPVPEPARANQDAEFVLLM